MRRIKWIAAAGLLLLPTQGQAADRKHRDPKRYDVPPGPLGRAIVTFGAQAGLIIGIVDPGLAQRPTRGVAGRLSVCAALRRLLAGMGAGGSRAGGSGYRST